MLDKQEFNSLFQKQVGRESFKGRGGWVVGVRVAFASAALFSDLLSRHGSTLLSLYLDTFNADLVRCFVRRHSPNEINTSNERHFFAAPPMRLRRTKSIVSVTGFDPKMLFQQTSLT